MEGQIDRLTDLFLESPKQPFPNLQKEAGNYAELQLISRLQRYDNHSLKTVATEGGASPQMTTSAYLQSHSKDLCAVIAAVARAT